MGNIDILMLLLEAGANIDVVNDNNERFSALDYLRDLYDETPPIFTSKTGGIMAALLLVYGANIIDYVNTFLAKDIRYDAGSTIVQQSGIKVSTLPTFKDNVALNDPKNKAKLKKFSKAVKKMGDIELILYVYNNFKDANNSLNHHKSEQKAVNFLTEYLKRVQVMQEMLPDVGTTMASSQIKQ